MIDDRVIVHTSYDGLTIIDSELATGPQPLVNPMRVTTAQLPPMDESADKIFVTPHAVIMLDGASAFVPVPVPASAYADHLGRCLADALTNEPGADLPGVLAEAIKATADHYSLTAGESP
ncbi:hypothetical protein [Amycolatopsis sacchari]|uniref:hypothetical protein n=1 Tax=Amycolatopsis sacchari TaxID=115433 RepID=UPI003EBAF37B